MDEQKFNPSESNFDPYGHGAVPQENGNGETESFGSPGLERESLERSSFDVEPVRLKSAFEPEFAYPRGEPPKEEPFTVPKNENVPAGIVGAFLFSLAGGSAAFLLSRLGYVAAISGFITILLAIFGYNLFSGLNRTKTQSRKAIVTGLIITAIVLLFADFCSMFHSIILSANKALEATHSPLDFCGTHKFMEFCEAFNKASPHALKSSAINLLLQYVFAAIGCWSYIRKLKAKKEQDK